MKERTIDILTAVFSSPSASSCGASLRASPRGRTLPAVRVVPDHGEQRAVGAQGHHGRQGRNVLLRRHSPTAVVSCYRGFHRTSAWRDVCFIQHLHGRRHIYYAHRADPRKTGKALLANLVFTAAFIVFFQVFFTNIMHIYFPEPFFG